MNKFIKNILTIAFACFFFNANAQESSGEAATPVAPSIDSVYLNTNTDQKGSDYFTPVNSISKVDERKVNDSVLQKLKSDDDYWYANETPKKKVPKKPLRVGAWTNTLFWILAIAGFVALLVWLLATGNIFLFRKKPREFKEEEKQEEEISEDIFSIDYEKEINKAVVGQNYRLAVRLLYLQTLKKLSHDELIQYTHEKTNSDYLFQLAGSKFYKDFFSLTRSFDYIWYGKFPLSAEGFNALQTQFVNFKQQLH